LETSIKILPKRKRNYPKLLLLLFFLPVFSISSPHRASFRWSMNLDNHFRRIKLGIIDAEHLANIHSESHISVPRQLLLKSTAVLRGFEKAKKKE
jgi:hypothetical protein